MATIVGISRTAFTGQDGTPVEGKTFFVTEAIDPKRGEGVSAERFFLSRAKLAALDFSPALGMEVEILYNRFGKVASLSLVDPVVDVE